MLGAQMMATFSKFNKKKNLKIFGSSRKKSKNRVFFDFFKEHTYKNIKAINPDYIINCIGLVAPKIKINSTQSKLDSLKINSILPIYLSSNFKNSKIIHISSDGVFNGSKGNYLETDKISTDNVYGITKYMGEITQKNVMNIRCSIVGFEKKTNHSLLNWFLKNDSKKIKGYKDQFWNGITTLALSRICLGIIKYKLFKNGIFHIFSKKRVAKYELLCIFNMYLNRNVAKIKPVKSSNPMNMTLSSIHKKYIFKLWKSAGYKFHPTINFLIKELI
jgi:dTDP-4-dehydrorhamnose reductase